MDTKTIALTVALLGVSRTARAEGEDRFFAEDKTLHFVVSAGITGVAYAALVPVTESRAVRLFGGAGVGILAGVAKESLDLAGYGDPSWKDLAWDAGGVATGALLAWALDLALLGRDPKRERVHIAPPLRLVVDF